VARPTILSCSLCHRDFSPAQLRNLCDDCNGPLLVNYDFVAIRRAAPSPTQLINTSRSDMWRYAAVLPADASDAVTLGEGWTPLLPLHSLGAHLGCSKLLLKDEGLNPTGSFKARGLSVAVTMARLLGAKKLAIPSAGNAAGALAAYAAAAQLESHIFMPQDVPQSNFLECKAYGASVTLVDGLISDCGRIVAERKQHEGWYEVSTLKEPYRIEGKKTMGYEVAEQLGWRVPDAILDPCGGGVGLIGMWKAFEEMQTLGLIGPKRPKMIAVQAAGCAPITKAFESGAPKSQFYENAHTVASGLRVPKPLGDFLILDAVRKSNGVAISISDEDMMDSAISLASHEGIFAAPEGGACIAALSKLLATGVLNPSDEIVIYNTGSGLKYLEAYGARFPRHLAREQDKLGGLITPR
jgi:threonine synthase